MAFLRACSLPATEELVEYATPEAGARKTAEYIADVFEVREVRPVETAFPESALDAGVAVLIVLGPLVRVCQDFVCLGDLFELLLGLFWLLLVPVRMVFHRELSVGLSDVVCGGVSAYAKNIVIIAFGRHLETSVSAHGSCMES